MPASRVFSALIVLAATTGLGACTAYDPYGYNGVSVGVGYGSPYSSYGYGYGQPYYGVGYGYPYYGGGYGNPYYGWYDGYYYPGTGYYVYDRRGSRQRWSDQQRRFWESRGPGVTVQQNWSGYKSQGTTSPSVDTAPRERTFRRQDPVSRPSANRGQSVRSERSIERAATRAASREEKRSAREERRSDREDQD